MASLELLQPMLQPGLVTLPLAGHEDEPIEQHALPENGNVLERFLQDNIDVAMHSRRICNPPQIRPVCVDQVVRHEHEAVREHGPQPPIRREGQLSLDGLVSADPHQRWSPPLGDCCDEDAKALLGHGHVSVVIILADEVERRPDQLRGHDNDAAPVEPCCQEKEAKYLHENAMLQTLFGALVSCGRCLRGGTLRPLPETRHRERFESDESHNLAVMVRLLCAQRPKGTVPETHSESNRIGSQLSSVPTDADGTVVTRSLCWSFQLENAWDFEAGTFGKEKKNCSGAPESTGVSTTGGA